MSTKIKRRGMGGRDGRREGGKEGNSRTYLLATGEAERILGAFDRALGEKEREREGGREGRVVR